MTFSADTRLLIIDPQNDFCDLSERDCPAAQRPALPVPGAHADMRRLARALMAAPGRISRIACTLDTHDYFDVAHPQYWMQGNGAEVAPFTEITPESMREGRFVPRREADRTRTLIYLDALARAGRYTLMVWPPHCIDGNWGHQVHDEVHAACQAWVQHSGQDILTIHKGMNPYTEHYSALQAEIADPADPQTGLNTALLDWVQAADAVWIAGEASSHCVRATVQHLLVHLPAGHASRITLLTDCMSPVAGFEHAHEALLRDAQSAGVRLARAAECFN